MEQIMGAVSKLNTNSLVFALIPVFPSLFFSLILLWQQGISITSMSFAFLLVLFSLVSGYFIWVWHSDDVEKLESYYQKKHKEGLHMLTSYASELERLLLTVEPKLAEQILAAKELTEQETSILIRRFTLINEELKYIFEFAEHASASGEDTVNFDALKNSAGKLRKEVDMVLGSLQFQDRVSQILTLVQNNLGSLRETLEQIQQQGTDRHKKMLNVEEIVTHIQAQYESVKQRGGQAASKLQTDDLTFF